MTKLKPLIGFFCLTLFFCVSRSSAQEKDATFEGIIVARDNVTRIVELQNYDQQDVIFILAKKVASTNDALELIKIVNAYRSERDALPPQMFSTVKKWRFRLRRDSACDVTVESWDDNFRFQFFGESRKLTPNIKVPCYILKKHGLKEMKVTGNPEKHLLTEYFGGAVFNVADLVGLDKAASVVKHNGCNFRAF